MGRQVQEHQKDCPAVSCPGAGKRTAASVAHLKSDRTERQVLVLESGT